MNDSKFFEVIDIINTLSVEHHYWGLWKDLQLGMVNDKLEGELSGKWLLLWDANEAWESVRTLNIMPDHLLVDSAGSHVYCYKY